MQIIDFAHFLGRSLKSMLQAYCLTSFCRQCPHWISNATIFPDLDLRSIHPLGKLCGLLQWHPHENLWKKLKWKAIRWKRPAVQRQKHAHLEGTGCRYRLFQPEENGHIYGRLDLWIENCEWEENDHTDIRNILKNCNMGYLRHRYSWNSQIELNQRSYWRYNSLSFQKWENLLVE